MSPKPHSPHTPHPLLLKQFKAAEAAFQANFRAAHMEGQAAALRVLEDDQEPLQRTPEPKSAWLTPQEEIDASAELHGEHKNNKLVRLNVLIATAIDLSEHAAGLHFKFGGETFTVHHSSTCSEAGDRLEARRAQGYDTSGVILVTIKRSGWVSVGLLLDVREHTTVEVARILGQIIKSLGMPHAWFESEGGALDEGATRERQT